MDVLARELPDADRAARDARIRHLRAQGVTLAALGQRFGLCIGAISKITKSAVERRLEANREQS